MYTRISDFTKNIFAKRNRAMLKELVLTDFKLRYQGSFLGYAWSLLKPLGLFSILYVVFVRFLKLGGNIEHISIYLLLGIVIWSFFTEATSGALQSIVSRGDVIRKIKFPKYIIVLASTIGALINLGLNLIIVFIFAAFNKVDFSHRMLSSGLFFLELYALVLGIGLFLAALYVKFRDIGHIWEVVLQGAFYATPILYPISQIEGINTKAAKILMLSPMAQIIQDLRFSIVSPQAKRTIDIVQYPFNLIPYILTALILILGVVYFKKNSKEFAESL